MVRKKRGRPRLPESEGKRHVIAFRATTQLREQLEHAAKLSGRSLSQEAEFRLELSFRDEEARFEAFGGKTNYDTMQTLAGFVRQVELKTGKSWLSDWQTFSEVKQAWEFFTTLIGPPISIGPQVDSGNPDLGPERKSS